MQEDASKFRLDRRLAQRRGWVPPEQLDKELAALPDVSEKAEVLDSPQHKSEAPAGAGGD